MGLLRRVQSSRVIAPPAMGLGGTVNPVTTRVGGRLSPVTAAHVSNWSDTIALTQVVCNNGVGLFKDNPKWLRVAADYLEGGQ